MSTLTSLAAAEAVEGGRALRTTTVRHVHVARSPLVCVPLALAGEANAPLAVMVGDDPGDPHVLIVPQPRNRDQRFRFAAEFGAVLLGYLGGFPAVTDPPADGREDVRAPAAPEGPQIWLPNAAGIDFFTLLGRSTRFRSPEGPYPVPVTVPRVGTWLTFFTERAELPGSSALIATTRALTAHWATGQSAVEDMHLPALMAWIDPPDGVRAAEMARRAEDPIEYPPAGPATDPLFDREVLAPAIDQYGKAKTSAAERNATTRLETALRSQMEPTWRLVWRAIELLRTLPAGEHVAGRWRDDVRSTARHYAYVAEGGRPQPKRDNAVNAARRLNRLEHDKANYDAQRAFDDPLVMAEHRLLGDAFAGVVTAVEPSPLGNRKLRPRITVRTEDRVRLGVGAKVTDRNAARGQVATILEVVQTPEDTVIVLELAGGMGRKREPAEGTVPDPDRPVCYSTLSDGYKPSGDFPLTENTPWTHGGPPTPPSRQDAGEEWS